VGADESLLRRLSLSGRKALMSEAKMRLRELAAWGIDEDEYRPAAYRGVNSRLREGSHAGPTFSRAW
jgi:hypothetical protein